MERISQRVNDRYERLVLTKNDRTNVNDRREVEQHSGFVTDAQLDHLITALKDQNPNRGIYVRVVNALGLERCLATAKEIAANPAMRCPAAVFASWASKERRVRG